MYIHFFFLFYYIHNSLADCECKSVNTLWNRTWVIIEVKDLHLYLVGGYQNLLKKKKERENSSLHFTHERTLIEIWKPNLTCDGCRWLNMRMHQRVNGGTGIGDQKGTWCWMGPISGKREPVHLQPMLELPVWMQDHLLLWVQWPWELAHSTAERALVADHNLIFEISAWWWRVISQ